MPKFSIVTPVFNNEKTIKRTLKSIMDQTHLDWHCILIDDSSTDNSVEEIINFINADKRISLKKRSDYSDIKGANCCRNIGLKFCKSNWVIFVDADDTLAPNCLYKRSKDILRFPYKDIYMFKTAVVNEFGEILWDFVCPTQEVKKIIYLFYAHKIPWHTMSLVWNKQFLSNIGGWNLDYERLQDVELSLRALLNKPKLFFSDQDYDSYYWQAQINTHKKYLARFSFCRIIKDYYTTLMNAYPNDEIFTRKIRSETQQILITLVKSYILYEKKDINWESLYLSLLKTLHISLSEIKSTEKAFNDKL